MKQLVFSGNGSLYENYACYQVRKEGGWQEINAKKAKKLVQSCNLERSYLNIAQARIDIL